uniref:Uncharacterized protein n=1 Tax=Eutreptiella gymnastica TaxID=73025 RepID=A0A7S1NWS2_9EUGL
MMATPPACPNVLVTRGSDLGCPQHWNRAEDQPAPPAWMERSRRKSSRVPDLTASMEPTELSTTPLLAAQVGGGWPPPLTRQRPTMKSRSSSSPNGIVCN